MKIEIDFKEDRVKDLIASALDAGIRYWCRSFRVMPGKKDATRACAVPLDTNGKIVLTLREPIKSDGLVDYSLDRRAIEKGLSLFPLMMPNQFGRWLANKDDAETGDVFVQLCLFGEVVFA